MPILLISCVSLPPATILSVPIDDFAKANVELASERMEQYNPCCGKRICGGFVYSFHQSGNMKCPFCNSDRADKTDKEMVGEMMKRVDVNDAFAMHVLGTYYYDGEQGLQQDQAKAMQLMVKAAELGDSNSHNRLGDIYQGAGMLKKAKFHYEAAAMTGHEVARNNLGCLEGKGGNVDRGFKHLRIAAFAGHCAAMGGMRTAFDKGLVSRESIDSTLEAYNKSCAEMRSEARDAHIRAIIDGIL
jgi:TPR repeat protein